MVVQCTWKPADGRDVGEAVIWSSEEETPGNGVEEDVQAENCLLLTAQYDGSSEYLAAPACQLLFSCHPAEQIQYVSVLSEARVMEVYGHHGEYLKTIRNELLEEVEDMAVFKGDIRLDRPLNVCSIKFACLRSKTEMWLYGVKVGISKVPNQPGEPLQIQFAEVEQRLKEMGISLSDNAEAFKQLFEAHRQNFSGVGVQDINTLLDLFKASVAAKNLPVFQNADNECVNGLSLSADNPSNINCANFNENSNEPTLDCSETIHSQGAEESNKINNNLIVLCNSETQTTNSPIPSAEDILKTYIDEKLEELENKVWEKVHKRFQEMEAKLLCKLDEIESFVKPQGVQTLN